MATAKKTGTTKKLSGRKPPGKKVAKRKDGPMEPAKVWVDRWAFDPIAGQKFRLILHKLPGKGNIPPKVIRDAVRKVREKRLAHEKAAVNGSPE
jgi:hypothetical protein